MHYTSEFVSFSLHAHILGAQYAYILTEVVITNKGKLNIMLDGDLIDYVKIYAEEQRTTVSEIFTQFILNLKRVKEKDPTEIILSDPEFKESLLQTISRIKAGDVKWFKYDEVF